MKKELRVLVVDDDPTTRKIVTKMINKKSFAELGLDLVAIKAEAVESGKKALEMLEKEKIDIIICDIEMPEMDGIELCRAIRNSEENCNLPFIFLSSHKDIEVRLEALNVGGNDYLSKPFSVQELFTRIKKVITTDSGMSLNNDSYNPLEQTSLKQVIELIIKHQLSGTLNIDFNNSSEGTINFEKGNITKTTFEQLQGKEAIKNILSRHYIAYSFEGKTPSDIGVVSSNIIKNITMNEIQKKIKMGNINECLNDLMKVEGAMAASVVDVKSGMALVSIGSDINLDVAAAGNSEVIKSKLKTLHNLGLKDSIEDILITLGQQYHLIRFLDSTSTLFIYFVLNRVQANLAMARYKLAELESRLEV